MRLLAHPFRLGPNGAAVTVEQGSDAAHAQEIAALLLTVRGERDLVPAFGISNPVLTGQPVDLAEVNAGVGLFGPDVEIVALTTTVLDATTERLVVTWRDPQEV